MTTTVPQHQTTLSATSLTLTRPDTHSADRSLRVVKLETLETLLAEDGRHGGLRELEVLNLLANTDKYIETVDPRKTPVALLSYRQERCEHARSTNSARGAGAFDHLTLDGAALRGVVAAAREKLGVEALWVDVWCYHFSGDYDHDHFCRMLHNVLENVAAVVWLPRTKLKSKGEYGYRLWYVGAGLGRADHMHHASGHVHDGYMGTCTI